MNGLVKPKEDYEGVAYQDMVAIPLDEIEEHTLAVVKHYNIPYEYVVNKMAYTDISVLYAKMANENAFKQYCEFIQLDDETRSKQVMEYGEVKPYVFELITPEIQEEQIKETNQNPVSGLYKNGGKFLNE